MKWLLFTLSILGIGLTRQGAYGQSYVVTKLKLFPDRDKVLIKDVARDSKGFVWFLTNGEIYRYDGYRSLDVLQTIASQLQINDMPQRILIDRQDRLWMVGNANLSYLDLKTWKVHSVETALLPPVQERQIFSISELSDATVVVAYENGHLLLVKEHQFFRVDDLFEKSRRSSNKMAPRSITHWKGKIWVGTQVGIMMSIDPAKQYKTHFITLPIGDVQVRSLIGHLDTLYIDVPGRNVAVRLAEGVGRQMQPEGFKLSNDKFFLLKDGLDILVYAEDDTVYVMNHDFRLREKVSMPAQNKLRTVAGVITGDEILLGTEEGIFVVYPKAKGLTQLIPQNNGPNKSTRGIYVYPVGSIFYSTYSGAGYIDSAGAVYTFAELKHAYALLPLNEHELLVGTEGGFLKVFNRQSRAIKPLEYSLSANVQKKYSGHLPNYVLCLAETSTQILIGGMNGLWLLDKKLRVLDRYELTEGAPHMLDLQIRHIHKLSDKHLLLSTSLGLFELKNGTLVKRYPQSGNMGVYKTMVENNILWIATQGAGLVGLDRQWNKVKQLTTASGLANNLVYSLEQIDGVKVLGTADGLNLVDGQYRVRRIGTAEGLSQPEFNSGASFVDARRKRVYVGGLSGYAVLDMHQGWFDPAHQLQSFVAEVHTSTGRTGQKSRDYTWPYRGETTLKLVPGQSLTALYVGTPGNYRAGCNLAYARNGGDWESLDGGQFISLIEPSTGLYDLQLRTRSTGLGHSSKVVTVIKLPHFSETWWFRGLLVLCAAGIVVLFYRSRVAKVRREQAIRNQIAADLHDEVGSSLTRIFFQANSLADNLEPAGKQDRQLALIADTSKQALSTMSDIVWSIDSRFDTMKDLVIRMKDYVYRLREELGFRYRFEEGVDTDAGILSQMVRQNIFLIFKEALNNAIKHSDGSEILIRLLAEPHLSLVVVNQYRENTIPLGARLGGRGLENMTLRAAKVGGKLSIDDARGRFCVTLEIPPKRGMSTRAQSPNFV
ncbi:sensor histidine kinase [Dyadobacter soli]|nr:histidine kinase [Dyadobacter soli]